MPSKRRTMKVTILGSGTNLHRFRAAAGYLVKTDQLFLVDFGPRTLSNLLKTKVNRHQIRTLLFTHYHADHFSDFVTFYFDAVCHSKFESKRGDLTLFGPRGTKRLFGTMLRLFPGFKEAPFTTTLQEVGASSFKVGETCITPVRVKHRAHLHCVGYRFEYQGRVFAYSGDASFDTSLIRLCHQADVAILDCSFPENRPGVGHLHAGECGRIAKMAGVKRLVLSHFYPVADRYDVKKQAESYFDGRVIVGSDLMRLVV